MEISFKKYHGTGNDFILIDDMDGSYKGLSIASIVNLCQRHLGVGSDGLVLLRKSEIADYNMDFYNPDGSQSLCGNGSRCAFQFAFELGYVSDEASFEAIDGVHLAKKKGSDISIRMNDVMNCEKVSDDYYINTGSPHYIQYRKDVDELEIINEAHKIRFNKRFAAKGTNVNFVKEVPGGIGMRTYERGVENETLSCGTGVTAAALSYALKNKGITIVPVNTRGGNLEVSFVKQGELFSEIWLTGPVQFVYEGKVTI